MSLIHSPTKGMTVKGFSLLELMVVLAIMGILATIYLIKIHANTDKNNLQQVTLQLKNALIKAQNKALGKCHHFVYTTSTSFKVVRFKSSLAACQSYSQTDISTATNWEDITDPVNLPSDLCIVTPTTAANMVIFDSSGAPDNPNSANTCHYLVRSNVLGVCRAIKIMTVGTVKILKPSEMAGQAGCTCSVCP